MTDASVARSADPVVVTPAHGAGAPAVAPAPGPAPDAIPTLFAWAGGRAALERLTDVFYGHVLADPVVGPVFARMAPGHAHHVAQFLAEVFGGPADYSAEHGGHATMLRHHLGRHLTPAQRTRWVQLLVESADEVELPDDPEFRSAFVAYVEWGSRLALLNSQDGAAPVIEQPMPRWGWGEVGGPYRPPAADAGQPPAGPAPPDAPPTRS